MNSLVIMFILYGVIGQGDGHWKGRHRGNLRYNTELFRKIAEKIEREVDVYYDEYLEQDRHGDKVNGIYKNVFSKISNSEIKTRKANEHNYEAQHESLHDTSHHLINNQPSEASNNILKDTIKFETRKNNNSTLINSSPLNSMWPKLEDMLSAMGKKYDWKKDRWMELKIKLLKTDNNAKPRPKHGVISTKFEEKHKFSYKIVRLNKSKSIKSVVVAVSAVR